MTENSTKNIFIIGAQCTGKSTLVEALRAAFGKEVEGPSATNGRGTALKQPTPTFIREVARNVLKTHNFTAMDITSSRTRALELQKLILAAQYEAETQHEQVKWYISDRSGLDPIVYARIYAGEDAAAEMMKSKEWVELQNRMRESLVIVCEAGCTWLVDDGVRLMPQDLDDWNKVHVVFCRTLSDAGIDYHIVPKDMLDLEERVRFVLDLWNGQPQYEQ